MVRRLSTARKERALRTLLTHKNLVVVEPYLGGGANGRGYGDPITLKRALIVDGEEVIRDQYDAETVSTATVFLERSLLAEIPVPETRVTIWFGTEDEREGFVVRCNRHHHPDIADLVEVKLR